MPSSVVLNFRKAHGPFSIIHSSHSEYWSYILPFAILVQYIFSHLSWTTKAGDKRPDPPQRGSVTDVSETTKIRKAMPVRVRLWVFIPTENGLGSHSHCQTVVAARAAWFWNMTSSDPPVLEALLWPCSKAFKASVLLQHQSKIMIQKKKKRQFSLPSTQQNSAETVLQTVAETSAIQRNKRLNLEGQHFGFSCLCFPDF